MAKLFTEFLGTFFLVLTIGFAVASGTAYGAFAVGGVLMALVYLGGHISGAHYNPAVTLAFVLRGGNDFDHRLALPYMGVQVLGGWCAALMTLAVQGRTFAPSPGEDVEPLAALIVELLFTLLLALVILRVATAAQTRGNDYYGLAIGATVMVAMLVAWDVSGAVLNPAVAIGPVLVELWQGSEGWLHLWLYILGPFLGGTLGAVS